MSKEQKRIKELNAIKNQIFELVNENHMTNGETAALLTTVMQNILTEQHNAFILSDLGVDVANVTIQQILLIQDAWATEYFSKLREQLE